MVHKQQIVIQTQLTLHCIGLDSNFVADVLVLIRVLPTYRCGSRSLERKAIYSVPLLNGYLDSSTAST
jgi:hypothetical protein